VCEHRAIAADGGKLGIWAKPSFEMPSCPEKNSIQETLMPLDFSVFNGNVTKVVADVLVLKFADRLYGADYTVAREFGLESLKIEAGTHRFFPSEGRISMSEVMFLGVGPLSTFEIP
jgi:hypothetical protein